MKFPLVFLLLLLLNLPTGLFSASSEQTLKTTNVITPDPKMVKLLSEFNVSPNIIYKQVGDLKLDLVLFQPKEKKFAKSPLVIFIHGGGWGGGNKYHGLLPTGIGVIRELNHQGVTVASIEYRLAQKGGPLVYDSAADCKDAIHFLVKNAAQYGLDPDRVATFGESAGGHLCLVTALGDDKDYPCDPSLGGPPYKIRCVASYYPLVSLVSPEINQGRNSNTYLHFIGGSLEEKKDIALRLSPTELLKTNSPPIFLAHGDADTILDYHNSLMMRDAAQAKGIPVECVISKGAGHSFKGENISPTIAEINQRTAAFLLKYLVEN